MNSNITFIYDGQCPFCNHFAELLELKSQVPGIVIKDGRKNLDEITFLYSKGYDLDNGAILIKGNEVLQGATAIYWICNKIEYPSDALLKLLSITFASRERVNLLFPFLIWARRAILLAKRVPRKLVPMP